MVSFIRESTRVVGKVDSGAASGQDDGAAASALPIPVGVSTAPATSMTLITDSVACVGAEVSSGAAAAAHCQLAATTAPAATLPPCSP